MLRAYKGYMCALCKTSSCDDSWDLLLQITGKGADGNVTFSPYVICKSCTGKHSGSGLAALGRQGRIKPELCTKRPACDGVRFRCVAVA